MIGESDEANHQYDIHDFYRAVNAGNFPAVSFLKAPGYQDAHAGYSDPLDEQAFVVQVINFLEKQPDWESTAVVIAYDDSDGWYDHQMGPIVNQSATAADALTGPGQCGSGAERAAGVIRDRSRARTLRLRSAPAPAGDLAIGQGRTTWTTRSPINLDHALHRRQLAGRKTDRRAPSTQCAGPLTNMFDFTLPVPLNAFPLILNENTGEPTNPF